MAENVPEEVLREIGERLAEVRADFEAMQVTMTNIETTLTNIETTMSSLEARLDGARREVASFSGVVQEMDVRLSARLDAILAKAESLRP